MKYSLWIIEHESPYLVMAYKIRDTNSTKEVDDWMEKSFMHTASFFREEDEMNADYLQTFQY
jgi:hypothetical protein